MLTTLLVISYIFIIFSVYFVGNIYITAKSTDEDYEWRHGYEGDRFRYIDSERNLLIIISVTWLITLPCMTVWYSVRYTFEKMNEIAENIKTKLKEKNVL